MTGPRKIKTLEIEFFFFRSPSLFLFVYSSYHLKLSRIFILGWFSNRTTELVRERQLTTARANQTTGLTLAWPMAEMAENGRAANWAPQEPISPLAPEVVFSPFRSLSRRQLLLNQPIYCFKYPEESIPYLDQATRKYTCQIFWAKNIPESKISNPKN